MTLTSRVARAIGAVDTTRHVNGRLLLKSHAQADAAVRATLVALIEEAGGDLRVREFLALTAGRHGIELPETGGAPPEPLPPSRTPEGFAL